MTVIYFDHSRADQQQRGFRTGEAGRVWIAENGEIESDTQLQLSANSVHALLHHGVVESLASLEWEIAGLGSGRDALLRPASLDAAATILYEADRKTYGAKYDISVGPPSDDSQREFRIAIDNREYQRTLSRLQFLVTQAARYGLGVRIRI